MTGQTLRTLAPQLLRGQIVPAVPLHKGREYHGSATHSDALAFRARQIARGMKVRQ